MTVSVGGWLAEVLPLAQVEGGLSKALKSILSLAAHTGARHTGTFSTLLCVFSAEHPV